MRILLANNYLYLRGGAERVLFNDREALERAGHQVIPFSAADPDNIDTPYSSSFVPGADIRAHGLVRKIRAAAESIHCRRTVSAFASFLQETKPDVIHCHNIYGRLSTAILAAARKSGIPTFLTVHDYKVVCPSYLMLRDGKPCTACLDGGYYRCATSRCHKGRLADSIVYSLEAYHARLNGHYDAVSAFLCPSRFIASLLRRSGIAESRIVYHPNSVEPDQYQPSFRGDYVLSVGRLSHEKGLPTFVESMLSTDIPVRIAGTGPMESSLRQTVAQHGGNIRFEGHCEGDKLAELYRNAAFVVVPSEWFENAPMSILESFAYGKPVVGTRIGGIPELITPGLTGDIVEPFAPQQLRQAVQTLWNDSAAQARMGLHARKLIETRFAQSTRTRALLDIYNSRLGQAQKALDSQAASVAATSFAAN